MTVGMALQSQRNGRGVYGLSRPLKRVCNPSRADREAGERAVECEMLCETTPSQARIWVNHGFVDSRGASTQAVGQVNEGRAWELEIQSQLEVGGLVDFGGLMVEIPVRSREDRAAQ